MHPDRLKATFFKARVDLKTLRAFCEIATLAAGAKGPGPSSQQIDLADDALIGLDTFIKVIEGETKADEEEPPKPRVVKLIFGTCLDDEHGHCAKRWGKVGVSPRMTIPNEIGKRIAADPDTFDVVECACPCHLPVDEMARRWRELQASYAEVGAELLKRQARDSAGVAVDPRAVNGG